MLQLLRVRSNNRNRSDDCDRKHFYDLMWNRTSSQKPITVFYMLLFLRFRVGFCWKITICPENAYYCHVYDRFHAKKAHSNVKGSKQTEKVSEYAYFWEHTSWWHKPLKWTNTCPLSKPNTKCICIPYQPIVRSLDGGPYATDICNKKLKMSLHVCVGFRHKSADSCLHTLVSIAYFSVIP